MPERVAVFSTVAAMEEIQGTILKVMEVAAIILIVKFLWNILSKRKRKNPTKKKRSNLDDYQ